MSLRISVIVPVYNDGSGLRETVQSLLEQRYPAEQYEVIIVDNGSTDDTVEVARGLCASTSPVVRLALETEVQSSYAARNVGIRSARGEILCFIDADMTAPPDYLQVVDTEMAGDVAYLGCRVELYVQQNTWAARYNSVFGFPVADYLRRHFFAPTCCLSIRRAIVDDIGGFDPRLESGGDWEFGTRVHAAGYRQAYTDAITLLHPARSSFAALLRKSSRTARGLAQLHFYYPERYAREAARFLGWRSYAPLPPWSIRTRYARNGQEISLVGALAVSVGSLPIRWMRPLAYLRESFRLRRDSSRHGTQAVNGSGRLPAEHQN